MDVKDLRTGSALSERNDGSKYSQGGIAPQCSRNKSYQDIGSNPLAKADPIPVRPCAVIGPDRVVPPPASTDAFLKKVPADPWPSPDSVYRRPPEYPHKILSNQNPSRNISPRQTFQENMQRIMVPPTYNAVRHSDDSNFSHIQDRNVVISKSVKPNMAPEAKYCDVPYAVNALTNEPKNVRDTEMYVPSVNSPLTRTAPHGWPPGSVNVHPSRTFGAHELYQYPQYPSCAGQRPTVMPMTRPHRTIQEEAYAYPDHYFQDASARFKPYPPVKERHPQPRYEYIGNYPTQFHHPPALQPHKYDLSKPGQPHPYSVYPHLKYLENRVPDHTMEAYQRPTNQQPHYNIQFRNQVMHPTYPLAPGSTSQKVHPYLPDGSVKSMASNKLPYDSSSKMFIDYENSRAKTYPMADGYFVNEMGRVHSAKNQMVMPNYSPVGMHSIPSQPYYRKDNSQIKAFEYMPHYRNFEPPMNNNPMMRHAPLFSPNTLAISPTDSNTSIDTTQTHGTSQEDCGYVSQSSTASVRSVDSGIYRLPHEYYKRYDFRYGPIVGSSPLHSHTKPDLNSNSGNSKEKQSKIDVRQFFQMWKDGEEENAENNNSKEIVIETGCSDTTSYSKHVSNQDQLYVLGLVNVPSEELGKYEHIQKISKLPENIKGYNNLELLSQFEEAIESSNPNGFKSIPKEYQKSIKDNSPKHFVETLSRPVSPLDVEAKISQSVIHKEVGCNFEIRPCSPQMLNVEVAAPAKNILGERAIEKVTNPLSKIVKSPIPIKPDENPNCHTITRQENSFAINDNPSCKMIRSPYATNNMESVKTNYSLQDLEINSGVCLASLPRLDNEIELNFPEVNQQFINANKKDDNSTINCPLTILKEDSGLSENKFLKTDLEKGENSLMTDESEKIFTKLSKYRKLKINPVDHSEKNLLAMAVRTDSVIIKNPENIKNIEDKLLENSLNVPMNLSSQSSVCHDIPGEVSVNKDHDVDMALDFSLNKSGSDLPIIDSEKDELMKSLTINLPHLSCDSYTDSSEPGNILTNLNENISNSKNIIPKCMKSELNKDICIKDNQDATMEVEAHLEDTIVSDNVKNETHASDLGNACIDSLISGQKSSSANKYLNSDTDHINTNNITEISDSLQTCKHSDNTADSEDQAWAKKSEKLDYTITSNNISNEVNQSEDFTNCSNLVSPHNESVSKYEESGEMMNLFSSESKIDGSEIAKSDPVCTQSRDDFENDEISASLEKMFQDCDDNTILSDRNNDSLDITVSTSIPTLSYHQSKELYSPWIQKLLTHSEGLCSNIDNESIEKDHIKSYSKDKETPDIVSKVEQSHNIEINQDTEIIGPLHHIENEMFRGKTSRDLVTNAEFVTKSQSITIQIQSAIVTDTAKEINVCLGNSENRLEELCLLPEISNVPQSCLEKSSNKSITNDNYQNDPELNVGNAEIAKKSNLEHYENDTLEDSKSVKDQVNDKIVDCVSVENTESKIKATMNETNEAQEEALQCDGIKGVSESKNIFQEDVKMNNFENLPSFISTNSTENQTEEKQSEESLLQSMNMNTSIDVATEIYDNRKIVSQFNTIQEHMVKPNSESLPNNTTNISDSSLDHQVEENQSEECCIEEMISSRDSTARETLETFDSNNGVCENDNVAQKVLNNSQPKTMSNSVNDISTEQKTKEIQSEECLIKTCDSQVDESLETYNTDKVICKNDNISQEKSNNLNRESMLYNAFDSTGLQTEGNKSEEYLKVKIQNDDSVAQKRSETINSDNITCKNDKSNILPQEELPNPNLERFSKNDSDNSTGHQASVTLESFDCSILVRKHDNKAQNEFNFPNPEILSHSISGMENLTENQNKDTADTPVISYTAREVDDVTELDSKDHNVEKFTNGVVDNYTGNQMHDKQNEESAIENKKISTNTISNTDVSEVCDAGKNNHTPDSLNQDCHYSDPINSIAKNVPKSVSDQRPEYENEENKSSIEISIKADDQILAPFEQCDDKIKSICHEDFENKQVQLDDEKNESNSNKQDISIHGSPVNRRSPLKRSFSESALDRYKNKDATDRQVTEHAPLISPSKRRRLYEFEHSEQHVLDENMCNLIHSNRRNSVSSFCNEGNVSFCILIDNDCIITEENEEDKICYAEISEDCITEINTTNEEDDVGEVICCPQENELDFSESVILDYESEKSFQESWLDDVACVETVVSDDIGEDIVISRQVSPRDVGLPDFDDSEIYNCNINELADDVKIMNEETMPDNISKIVQTHHIDVNMMLYDNKTQDTDIYNDMYMGECSQKKYSEFNSGEISPSLNHIESMLLPDDTTKSNIPGDKENLFFAKTPTQNYENCPSPNRGNNESYFSEELNQSGTSCNITHNDGVDSYESSIDNVFSFKGHDGSINYTISSSPEVSSTTSEEKSSSILLKITNYNGSRVSEVNEVSHNRPRCKFTEKKEYSNSYGSFPKRPLITKAAQKYIPPLKESIGDLKVKLSLPQQKLLKLKQLKLTKNEPKVNKHINSIVMIPKKPKPNFEDVLKSIDEVQIKMHKEKSKKVRNIVPKVVIKKNLNGSHYTSSSNKDTFNPDLTGRKWQPWVFLEKNHFIDKMATRNKTKAIFSHRKNTYVFAEKFKKYKSASNCSAKFVISQPTTGGSSKGQLKYTIRLKHTY